MTQKKLNTATKKKGYNKWSQKFKDTKYRLIQFLGRTLQELTDALQRLKEKYKKVSLDSKKYVGSGRYMGYIKLAL